MGVRRGFALLSGGLIALAFGLAAVGGDTDTPSAERGREILTSPGHLPPAWRDLRPPWKDSAYKKARRFLGPDAPDPDRQPGEYAAAFNRHFGLHPAPYPNDGLPMGLRLSRDAEGQPNGGLTLDCLVCHGGSIGGKSYVGLGNTQLDISALLPELTRADDRPWIPPLFVMNTARGTVNAGQMAVVLLSMRNTDLSVRKFPLLLGAHLPEIDTPAWWVLAKKLTKYYDGRTDADDHRSNMQFLLGGFTLEQFRETEDAFKDLQAFFESLTPPKYPFETDAEKASRGRAVFEATCSKCHGTYGPGGTYPNRIIELDVIGTDPVRAKGVSLRSVLHYNATWFGQEYPVDEEMIGYQAPPLDGIWATAPYLHNGSVPTLHHLLKSGERPKRFRRPPSTDFEFYDRERVGWKFEDAEGSPDPKGPAPEARSVFDTARWGLGNGGHTFGDKLSDEERAAVIEYLKTL